MQLLAVQKEVQVSLGVAGTRVLQRLPVTSIPEHHGPTAVFTPGDQPLEVPIVHRVIFNVNGQPLVSRIEAWTSRHGPALEHAIKLESKVVMQPRGGMLLD